MGLTGDVCVIFRFVIVFVYTILVFFYIYMCILCLCFVSCVLKYHKMGHRHHHIIYHIIIQYKKRSMKPHTYTHIQHLCC